MKLMAAVRWTPAHDAALARAVAEPEPPAPPPRSFRYCPVCIRQYITRRADARACSKRCLDRGRRLGILKRVRRRHTEPVGSSASARGQ
jgi:hypothetical protein